VTSTRRPLSGLSPDLEQALDIFYLAASTERMMPVAPTDDEVERVLEQILALGDARAVPCLVELLGAVEQRVRDAVVRTLDGLVPRGLTDLVLLESKIRDRGGVRNSV
jgi:hypothetical protein